MSDGPNIVELENVSRVFVDGERRREVLKDVSFAVKAREMVALVGPSGCGKTTLLNIIGALDERFEGEAKLLGRSLRAMEDDDRTALRNSSIGFVFQAFHLLEHLTVVQNVQVPLWLLPSRLPKAEEEARAKTALETVGLGDRLHDSVRPLSGGERQRVAIARAMVNRPTLLLADEPTGNLDRDTGASIYALFDQIRAGETACAIVVATHDAKLAESATRRIAIANGKIE